MHTKGRQLVTSTKAPDILGGINLGRLALRVIGPAFSCSNKPDPGSHLLETLTTVLRLSQRKFCKGHYGEAWLQMED